MEIESLLRQMVEQGASDMFITAGAPPSMKRHGRLEAMQETSLDTEQARQLVLSVMTDEQRHEFETHQECNFAIASDAGRFRVSAFAQRNQAGMVLRRIETEIPELDDLGLPDIIKQLAMTKRGLVFFVGATGTGKSTSLAAMIGHRNQHDQGHIISIEDPIEFVHQHRSSIVTQREVGIDTESFEVALKNTLRQAPDVIMIGEVRSQETMEYALAFAETGHLCLATLHANNANQTLDRIMSFFPADRQSQLWMDLSLNLRGVVAQQLVPTPDGQGRKAIVEVLLNSPLVADHIRKGEVHLLKEVMAKSGEQGMQTFDQALFKAYQAGEIRYEDALAHADSANDLRLMIKLEQPDQAESLGGSTAGLSIQDKDDY